MFSKYVFTIEKNVLKICTRGDRIYTVGSTESETCTSKLTRDCKQSVR